MFDLERAIAEWRERLDVEGIKSSTVLDELEGHLREEVERATNFGLIAEKAFTMGIKKIGQGAILKAEFEKNRGDHGRYEHRWMRVYFYCMAFPAFYSAMCAYGLFKLDMTVLQRAAGFTALGVTCILLWTTTYYHRFLPAILSKRRREIIQAGCSLIWIVPAAVFMNFALPHLNLNMGELCVTVLWLMAPTAALSGIGHGLGEAARRRFNVA